MLQIICSEKYVRQHLSCFEPNNSTFDTTNSNSIKTTHREMVPSNITIDYDQSTIEFRFSRNRFICVTERFFFFLSIHTIWRKFNWWKEEEETHFLDLSCFDDMKCINVCCFWPKVFVRPRPRNAIFGYLKGIWHLMMVVQPNHDDEAFLKAASRMLKD